VLDLSPVLFPFNFLPFEAASWVAVRACTILIDLCCIIFRVYYLLYPSTTSKLGKSLSRSPNNMSFSADKVNVLKGAFSQRRFSSSKDPTESGMYPCCFFPHQPCATSCWRASCFPPAPFLDSKAWKSFRMTKISCQLHNLGKLGV
jgi:hypothetical protein